MIAGVGIPVGVGVTLATVFHDVWRPGLGAHRLFLTRRGNLVWVQTEKGWLALSPDEPDAFVERLRARLPLQ
jgi:hypothetical protein